MGGKFTGLALALASDFFHFLGGAAELACKALTDFPFC